MSLNKDQQNAFADIIKFINDDSRKYHHVSGGPGTGKTYLISQIVDNILKYKSPSSKLMDVVITATTQAIYMTFFILFFVLF